jgi:phytoene dehydrogenase-like protein
MENPDTQRRAFDAIVIGSGIGGLAAAAALAKRGRRVLVLEQHTQLGGLTQTFERRGYRFATGVHYLGTDSDFLRLLGWLAGDALELASLGSPYDIVRLPGFEFPVEAPRAAYVGRLKATFPGEAAAIDGYFRACDEAKKASIALFAAGSLPAPAAAVVRWLNARRVSRALGTTTAEAAHGFRDRRLAALLMARWGDYGVPPERSPLAVHALVTGSYFDGACYPAGGPAKFAEALGATISAAGGELRTQSPVAEIRVAAGRAAGVRLSDGQVIEAPLVISAMGAQHRRGAAARRRAGLARGGRLARAERLVSQPVHRLPRRHPPRGRDAGEHVGIRNGRRRPPLGAARGRERAGAVRVLSFAQGQGACRSRAPHRRGGHAVRLGTFFGLGAQHAGPPSRGIRSRQGVDRRVAAGAVQAPLSAACADD